MSFGINRIRTTAYHPQSNGLVERFHRHLKSSLKCIDRPSDWYSKLPFILLALRNCFKDDLKASPAEMVCGQTLKLPADMFNPENEHCSNPDDVLHTLRRNMSGILPPPTRKGKVTIFTPKDLANCLCVWIGQKKVSRLLTKVLMKSSVVSGKPTSWTSRESTLP